MIHYDIDIPEDTLQGSVETFDELKRIIDDHSSNFLGYIDTDTFRNLSLFISSVKELGIFIGIRSKADFSKEFLSLFDSNMLSEVVNIEVDVGNEIYVSKGLFIPAELAWIGVEDFITNGVMTDKIQWITPKDLPEEGNWIT